MQACEIENVEDGLATAEAGLGHSVWAELSQRLNHLSALARVQAHAIGVPALATLLMQGLVL
jgi:hypothetical protein